MLGAKPVVRQTLHLVRPAAWRTGSSAPGIGATRPAATMLLVGPGERLGGLGGRLGLQQGGEHVGLGLAHGVAHVVCGRLECAGCPASTPTAVRADTNASSTAPSSRTVVPAMSRHDQREGPIISVHPRRRERVGGDRRRAGHAPAARAGHHPHPLVELLAGTDVAVDTLGVDALPAPRHRGSGAPSRFSAAGQEFESTGPRRARNRTARRRRACRRWSGRRRAAAPGGVGDGGPRPPVLRSRARSSGTTLVGRVVAQRVGVGQRGGEDAGERLGLHHLESHPAQSGRQPLRARELVVRGPGRHHHQVAFPARPGHVDENACDRGRPPAGRGGRCSEPRAPTSSCAGHPGEPRLDHARRGRSSSAPCDVAPGTAGLRATHFVGFADRWWIAFAASGWCANSSMTLRSPSVRATVSEPVGPEADARNVRARPLPSGRRARRATRAPRRVVGR